MWKRKWLSPTHDEESPNRPHLAEYSTWIAMMGRCRVGGAEQRKNICYVGCEVFEPWQSYDVWLDWAKQQVGFLNYDDRGNKYQLDKDILFKGNKTYNPDTCVFIPKALNTFSILRGRDRGDQLIGVRKTSAGKFEARICLHGEAVQLGTFSDELEAFSAYKATKEQAAKDLAVKYKGLVDERVITALNTYTITLQD